GEGEANCRVRASPHRLRTGRRLSNPYGEASSIAASSNGARSFALPTISREARESMQMSDIKKIAVIGAGTMGAGIAQACAAAGFQVAVRDREQRFVGGGLRRSREPLTNRAG